MLPFDDREYRAMEERAPARARDLRAGMNHLRAGAAPEERTVRDLARITAPALVLHGAEDPTYPLPHAEAIPGARLVVIEGLGHALPAALDSRLAGEILRHTATD
ncbi:hypothetical protein [Streptomyces sp.]|uniref:alpha/beta fold hydrolase n=1 Tax=Streptomyces sp. TaxID=1931 RepID=UPI00281205B5|nr:hypothetical protein [Streptomyces sp.]